MFLRKLFITGAISCLAFVAMGQQVSTQLPASKNCFVVIAHRGSHLIKPENTLAAIDAAINEGADYVEVDLRTTKDGHLVLCHDEKVDRTTNGKGLVKNLTWAEIAKFTTIGKDKKVYHIPDFKKVLKACKNRISIYLDFKDADVTEAYKQVKDAGMEKNMVVYLNKEEQYAKWRKIAPAMPLMSSLPDSINNTAAFLIFLGKMQVAVLDNLTDSTMLAAARENKIQVWLDVQGADEGPLKWSEVMNKGIQGVQTDHPGGLVAYLLKNNLRNGARNIKWKH